MERKAPSRHCIRAWNCNKNGPYSCACLCLPQTGSGVCGFVPDALSTGRKGCGDLAGHGTATTARSCKVGAYIMLGESCKYVLYVQVNWCVQLQYPSLGGPEEGLP